MAEHKTLAQQKTTQDYMNLKTRWDTVILTTQHNTWNAKQQNLYKIQNKAWSEYA